MIKNLKHFIYRFIFTYNLNRKYLIEYRKKESQMVKKLIKITTVGLCLAVLSDNLTAVDQGTQSIKTGKATQNAAVKKTVPAKTAKKTAPTKAAKKQTSNDPFVLARSTLPGSWAKYKELTAKDATIITKFDGDEGKSPGSTTLHYALGYRRLLIFIHTIAKFKQELTSHGIVLHENKKGNTPLKSALVGGSPRAVAVMALFHRSTGKEFGDDYVNHAKTIGNNWKYFDTQKQKDEQTASGKIPFWRQKDIIPQLLSKIDDLSAPDAAEKLSAILEKYDANASDAKELEETLRVAIDDICTGIMTPPKKIKPEPKQEVETENEDTQTDDIVEGES